MKYLYIALCKALLELLQRWTQALSRRLAAAERAAGIRFTADAAQAQPEDKGTGNAPKPSASISEVDDGGLFTDAPAAGPAAPPAHWLEYIRQRQTHSGPPAHWLEKVDKVRTASKAVDATDATDVQQNEASTQIQPVQSQEQATEARRSNRSGIPANEGKVADAPLTPPTPSPDLPEALTSVADQAVRPGQSGHEVGVAGLEDMPTAVIRSRPTQHHRPDMRVSLQSSMRSSAPSRSPLGKALEAMEQTSSREAAHRSVASQSVVQLVVKPSSPLPGKSSSERTWQPSNLPARQRYDDASHATDFSRSRVSIEARPLPKYDIDRHVSAWNRASIQPASDDVTADPWPVLPPGFLDAAAVGEGEGAADAILTDHRPQWPAIHPPNRLQKLDEEQRG
jgi:hypothetical protein